MTLKIEDVVNYLGKTIHDLYGRRIGSIVGVYSEVDGTVTAIEVCKNDALYETIPAERLEIVDGDLRILPAWYVKARIVEKKLDVLRKRLRALEELYRKNQIPEHAYRELKEKLSKELDKTKSEAKELKEELRNRVYELENFVLHIEKAMTNLLVSYTAGEIPEQSFETSINALRIAKQRALEEKKDIEKHSESISKLEEEVAKALEAGEESGIEALSQGPMVVKVFEGV